MEPKLSELIIKTPLPLYPPPDFSVPPPALQETSKAQQTTTTTKSEVKTSSRDYSKSERRNSRDRQRSRYSPPSSRNSFQSQSRDYRSQSQFSSSSRYSNRDRDFRRSPDRSSKRRRSRSKSNSRASSRRSPNYKSSRKSPLPYRENSSRSTSHRHSPKRDTRDSREAGKRRSSKDPQTEREKLLAKWRKNYCETSEQISKKLQELANDEEQVSWIRSSPADIHYRRTNGNVVESTPRLDALCTLFDEELLKRSEKIKTKQALYGAPSRRRKARVCRHKGEVE